MSGGESRLLGRWGEALAAEELRRRGCRLVEAGFRAPGSPKAVKKALGRR